MSLKLFSLTRRSFSTVSDKHMQLFSQSAKAILDADALYITAGAGMGVDSGLPDFRSNTGFWRAYPPLKRLNVSFADMANPSWFDVNPRLAWGFYGHRLKLYESTQPHDGYNMLLQMANSARDGYFVYTSNVDGHFVKAGYDKDQVVECHGSIHYVQCSDGLCGACQKIDDGSGIVSIKRLCALSGIDYKTWLNELEIDENTFEIKQDKIPKCLLRFVGKKCANKESVISRPNILMFGDMEFKTDRVNKQYDKLDEWKGLLKQKEVNKVCVIEMGAGSFVPRVRYDSDSAASSAMVDTFIRINITHSEATINPQLRVPKKIELPFGALFAIQSIFKEWKRLKGICY
eukprot:295312_1